MFLNRLFQRFARTPDASQSLYERIVAAARREIFYAAWGVPDTVEGRFNMISLHVFLVLDRLKGEGAEAEAFRQDLADTFFKDMDRSLREMGVGDLSVGKKVRKMAEAFYGRALAYSSALEKGEGLEDALRRNVYADRPDQSAEALAQWVRTTRGSLRGQPANAILSGEVTFP